MRRQMRHFGSSLAFVAGLALCVAQAHAQKDGWQFKWSGMINPQIWADSRQVVSGREDMMDFYPKPRLLDAQGNDINAVPSLNMLSITNRLGLTIKGPQVLGADMGGYIEVDFTGSTNEGLNMLRLRHGYINLKWEHQQLLAGQYWHPMVVHEIMPATRPLNMGAPFHPYGRFNQLRYSARLGKAELLAVAAFQTDNKSQGPYGASTEYLKHSMVPELNMQLRYVGEHLFAGGAANLLATRPYYRDLQRQDYNAHISYSLFVQYNWTGWSLRSQSLLNSNIYEASSLGGYVVNGANVPAGVEYTAYSPYTFTTLWLDFGRTGGKLRPGFFAGCAANNQFGEWYPNVNGALESYGRGIDIEYLYRFQPRLAYAAGNGLTLFAEWEYTCVHYGSKQTNLGSTRYVSSENEAVANNRIILSAVYSF